MREIDGSRLQNRNNIYYLSNEQQAFTGIATRYYENGQVSSKRNYIDGKQCGEIIRFYKNGQVLNKANYIDGKYHGEFLSYYENGQLEEMSNWQNGKLHGKFIRHCANGQVECSRFFIDGIPQ